MQSKVTVPTGSINQSIKTQDQLYQWPNKPCHQHNAPDIMNHEDTEPIMEPWTSTHTEVKAEARCNCSQSWKARHHPVREQPVHGCNDHAMTNEHHTVAPHACRWVCQCKIHTQQHNNFGQLVPKEHLVNFRLGSYTPQNPWQHFYITSTVS